jgi:hypothetical protein
MEKVILNNRVRTALILFTGIVILMFLLVYINFIALHVDRINPPNGVVGVTTQTQIEIEFSRNINPSSLDVQFNPKINFRVTHDSLNKKFVLTPNFSLTPNTKYTVSVKSPASFTSSFTTQIENSNETRSYEYQESTQQITQQESNALKKDQNIISMRDQLPITKPTFTVRYTISNNSYVIKTNGAQGKNDFLKWLQDQGITEDSLNIVYTDSTKPDFNIISDSFSNQTISVAEPIKLNFTDPIKIETLNLTIEPNIPVLYSFNDSLTQIIISPVNTWSQGTTYKVTVKGSTQSRTDQPLTQDYNYTFNTQSENGI